MTGGHAPIDQMIRVLVAHSGVDLAAMLLTVVAMAIAYRQPGIGSARTRGILRLADNRIARRRGLAVVVSAAAVLLLRTALLPVLPAPTPGIHDEYSNILAGQTFARGRLANPPHPMWRSLETHIVLQHPTYASYRPPGPGLLLAAGEKLGSAWIGVLLSSALFCGAVTWALQAWTTPLWTLAGGTLSVFGIGLLSYWTNSYWGGSLAAAGGALIIGSLPRIARTPGARAALPMAAGMFPLLLTRPYEGAALTGASVFALAWMLHRGGKLRTPAVARTAVPLAAAGIVLLAATAIYNRSITGSWTRSPYLEGTDTYHEVGLFVWDRSIHWKRYTNPQFATFFSQWELRRAAALFTWRGLLTDYGRRAYQFAVFFLRGPYVALLLVAPLLLRRRRLRPVWFMAAVFAISTLLPLWFTPHYVAPATVLVFILLAEGLRALGAVRGRGGRRIGPFLPVAVVTITVAMTLVYVAGYAFGKPLGAASPMSWCCVSEGNLERARIEKQLERMPGRHLVLVYYSPSYDIHTEWVYNEPEIDKAKVVWARSLGPEEDGRLERYFSDRAVWKLDLGAGGAKLTQCGREGKTWRGDRRVPRI